MLAALTILATSEEGASQAPFYILGAVLAGFAVLVGVVGIARHQTFPPSAGAARAVMGVAALLVVAVAASSVLTS